MGKTELKTLNEQV